MIGITIATSRCLFLNIKERHVINNTLVHTRKKLGLVILKINIRTYLQ